MLILGTPAMFMLCAYYKKLLTQLSLEDKPLLSFYQPDTQSRSTWSCQLKQYSTLVVQIYLNPHNDGLYFYQKLFMSTFSNVHITDHWYGCQYTYSVKIIKTVLYQRGPWVFSNVSEVIALVPKWKGIDFRFEYLWHKCSRLITSNCSVTWSLSKCFPDRICWWSLSYTLSFTISY